MALKLDDPPQDYDDNQPSWQTNLSEGYDDLENAYDAPSATDANLPPGHPSRSDGGTPSASADEAGSPDSYSPSELQDAESDIGPSQPTYGAQSEYDRLPGGSESSIPYSPEGGERFRDKARLMITGKSNYRRSLGGGFIGGGFIGLIISLMALLLPMKLNHFIQNLQEYYFANNQSAITQRVEQLFISYMKTAIIPNMTPGGTCSTTKTISKDCVITSNAETPAGRLFNAWRDARFENKLADKYGIEFEKGTGGGASGVRMKVKGLPDIDFEEFATINPSGGVQINKANYRRAVNKAIENQTLHKRMYLRFKIGGLVERKYGNFRCLIACDTRNRIDGSIKDAKRFARITVVNRIITPRSDALGFILTCIFDTSSSGCNTDPAVDDPDNDTERRSALQKELLDYADRAGREVSEESIEKAVKVIDDLNQAGSLGEYIAGKIGAKLAGEAGEKVASSAVPVVGWVNLAASLIYKSAQIGKFVRYAGYAQHATEAVTLYTTWATFNDEIKNGYADPAIISSMAGSLSYGIGETPSNQPAEIGPVWGDISNKGPRTSMIDSFLPTAFAQANTVDSRPKYTCNDGEVVPANKKICPEEDFRTNNALTDISDALNNGPQSALVTAAGAWNETVNLLGKPIEAVSGAILAPLEGIIGSVSGWFTDMIGKHLIKSAVTDTMSGARVGQVLAAGANVVASDGAQQLGAPKVDAATAYRYRQQYMNQLRSDFASKPLMERLFARDDANSLLSHVAFATPTDTNSISGSNVATLFANPIATIGNSFASAFGTNKAYAQTVREDPFGIPQHAYDPADPIFNADPAVYTDDYCSNITREWNDSFVEDNETGQMVPSKPNPCLLERAAVTAAGGIFDTSLIPKEDLGGGKKGDAGTAVGNNNVAIFGDSLTVGMRDAGGLAQKLTAAGWNPSVIDATVSIDVPGTLPKIEANAAQIKQSGTIVIMLGTNGGATSAASAYEPNIDQMIGAIKRVNPSIKIYWMNVVGRDAQYDGVNQAIATKAVPLGYNIIDWRAEIRANPSKYPFSDAVHHTAAGYNAKADFLVAALGVPPTAEAGTGGVVGDIGLNSDGVPCAPGTNDLGVVDSKYRGARKKEPGVLKIRLCQVPDIPGTGQNTSGSSISGGAVINSRVSGAWASLGAAAKAAGVGLNSSSSFRLADSCGGTGDGSACATPGNSPHQLGVAIDFGSMGYPDKGTSTTSCSGRSRKPEIPGWAWLFANAEKWGIEQYSYESWHWDLLGGENRCNSSE